MSKLSYTIVVEKARNNFSAYAPDLPGCVATGRTQQQVIRRMEHAIALHVRGMIEDGEPIPVPSTTSRRIQVRLSAA